MKILKIESCSKCPFRPHMKYCNYRGNQKEERTLRDIETYPKIPEWCKLEEQLAWQRQE